MSFIIPVSIILLLSTETLGGTAYSTIRSTWGWEPAQKTALYFSLWAFKEVFLNIFKYWLMVHAFGMSKAHYDLIIGPRSEWTGKEVDIICNTYGRKRILNMDESLLSLGESKTKILLFKSLNTEYRAHGSVARVSSVIFVSFDSGGQLFPFFLTYLNFV